MVFFRRRGREEDEREEEVAEERLGGGTVGSVLPVDVVKFHQYFLQQAEAAKQVATPVKEVPAEALDLQFIEDTTAAIKRVFMQKGSLVVSIASKESFVEDVKRKVTLIYSLLQVTANSVLSDLMSAIEEYEAAVKSNNQSLAEDALRRINDCIKKLNSFPVILIKLIDEVSGILQVNLPLDLMPNFIKVHLGAVTT